MQKCPLCNKEVRYISTNNKAIVTCEVKKTTIYNEFGRKITGYKIHECEVRENGTGIHI